MTPDELVFKLINPETRFFLEHDTGEVIDLEDLLGLMNGLRDDPVLVCSSVLRYLTICKMAYGRLAESKKSLKAQMELIATDIKSEALNPDPAQNRYYGKTKPTVAFANSLVESDETYLSLKRELDNVSLAAENVWRIHEIAEKVHQTMLSVLESVEHSRLSGEVISPSKIKGAVEEFRAGLDVKL